MELCGFVLLADRVYMFAVVVFVVSVQYNAGVDTAVRGGGDRRGAAAGPAGGEAEEGGADGEASGGVRAGHCDRRAGALGRSPLC